MANEHLFATRVVELEKYEYYNPVGIGGFVGPGLVGLISASYLVEQLGLHQIGHVTSQHIPPVAVFVGGKLRHPFRIYRSKEGKLVLIICEVPIDSEGLYEVSSVLLSWLVDRAHLRELVILDGFPVQDIPSERVTRYVAGQKRSGELDAHGLEKARSALIGGVGGSLLNECLSRGVEGLSLITQASVSLPDPGAVLTMIQTLNSVYQLRVGTEVLEQNVAQLNKELSAVAEQYGKLAAEAQQHKGAEEKTTMYG
ncbi:MAG: proteasome assembly chaperone family protein [Nitrososphaerales archaeon]